MINVAVEGDSDRGAAAAVISEAGRSVSRIFVAGGKTRLDPKIKNYNRAAKFTPWAVFRDSDGACPVDLRAKLTSQLTQINEKFVLRIAHSMTEAWLMADAQGFASYFHVSGGRVPADVEMGHAKQRLLSMCTASSLRSLRRDVVTDDGDVGPLYVDRINDFAANYWNVTAAASNSPSLERALKAIGKLVENS